MSNTAIIVALAQRGIYVGGSSGIAYAGANHLTNTTKHHQTLTFFPDRGDIYGDTFLGATTPQHQQLPKAS